MKHKAHDVMLTKKQAAILDAVRAHIKQHGVAPSLADLCFHMGTKSVGSMSKHLSSLVDKGVLERKRRGWRQVRPRDVCPCCGSKMRRRSDG